MGSYATGDTQPRPTALKYSVVVPFYDEQDIIEKLTHRILKVMDGLGESYEVIVVNDGSNDRSADVLDRLTRQEPKMVFVDLRRNFGQTTALQAGFDQARGEIIIAMDGDMQHDPYEIPMFVRKIDEGYDIASGWRVRRRDSFFLRRIPSRVANWMLAKVSGLSLHDFGTTFKAYRREVLEGVRLYGDMHRFVPAVCARLGARIAEVPIKNVRRPAGQSKYGIARTFRVALDVVCLRFITAYLTRPLHFFGKWGLASLAAGVGILGYGLVRKFIDWDFAVFSQHGPLMALGFLLVVMALMFLACGLMGELMMRIYFESTPARTYAIKRIIRGDREDDPGK